MPESSEITLLLRAARDGDQAALDRVINTTYAELRRLAQSYMAKERRDHTLQPTALVHEACIHLLGRDVNSLADRQHFFACAAQQMRRVLLDHARSRRAQKRGGNELLRVTTVDLTMPQQSAAIDMLILDEALDALAKQDPRQCQIVELRYFAGMTAEEIAEVLNVTVRTVRRDWVHARALLARHLGRGVQAHGSSN
ncbi:MAG TPA: sigma-70 family RNA polymerase sigma factor [Bryobacteraceae bacterium]|nr:sigma-70 family RNA polymerase sigma factor [Bryobacteraceae bacterium]